MSSVYLAEDTEEQKVVAIKNMKGSSEQLRNAFVAEAAAIRGVDHPKLPAFEALIEENGSLYVVMEFIPGKSLMELISKTGPQDINLVLDWSIQLCEVLGYLHSLSPPVIYRDMKPANIILRPNGAIALVDFGAAREQKAGASEDTVLLGTHGYAAPEQYGGYGQSDPRTDIYSLGATIFHLVSGMPPRNYPLRLPMPEEPDRVLHRLAFTIEKCTKRDPNERYHSCNDLSDDLQSILSLRGGEQFTEILDRSEKEFTLEKDFILIQNIDAIT